MTFISLNAGQYFSDSGASCTLPVDGFEYLVVNSTTGVDVLPFSHLDGNNLVFGVGNIFIDWESISGCQIFAKTTTAASYLDNLNYRNSLVVSEFGSSASQADWNDLLLLSSSMTANTLIDYIDQSAFETHDTIGDGALLLFNGNPYSTGQQAYHLAAHSGSVPDNWGSHANLYDHELDLGSWYVTDVVLAKISISSSYLALVSALLIVGTANEDQTLTADISYVSDEDGINPATLIYQWLRDGTVISGATGSSYELAQADVGKNISLRYSYTDNYGTAESVTSAATAAVQNVNDIPIGSVSIGGQVKVGNTLSANSASLSDADGLGVLSYQWLRDDEAISQATSSAYRLSIDDYGHKISVRVTYTDDFGQNESVTSTETVSVGPSHNGTTGSDVITGTAESDVITGLAGNDWIFGTGGNDALYGGAGNDTIDDGTGDDTIDGGSGVDTLKRDYAFATDYSLTLEINLKSGTTSSPNFPEENPDILISIENLLVTGRCSFVLTGSDVANMLHSSTGNDFLSGNGGNDTLNGGGGSDTMIGGYGDDYFITNGADTILESVGQGSDTVESTVNYSLGDNIENLILAGSRAVDGTGNALGNNVTGNGEANLLRGMAGNDTVSGMSGNDTLDGGSGRDILSGGKGNDRIIGGSGADVFVFNRGDGTDTVTDFVNGLDVLQIANGAERFADITVLDSGLNVTISFANVKVTLLNLDHSSIDASDFAFV